MPRKLRTAKPRVEGINESLLHDLSNGRYPKPENYNRWVMLAATGEQIKEARLYLKASGYTRHSKPRPPDAGTFQ
jgi:hypothetical protein